jgi:hypothetical protein
MKITTDKNFIISRFIFVILSAFIWIIGQPFASLALLAIITQTTFHEFIHAFVVQVLGGNVGEITLTRKGHYVDFTMPPGIGNGKVYFAGFAWDLLCVFSAAWLFFMAGNWLYMIFGYALVIIALCYHVIPQHSDFNMWMGTHHVCD